MLRRLYDRIVDLAAHPRAARWLFVLSAAEASLCPIPVEAMLLPMMFAAPRRAWVYAAVATAGSVVGGAIGYAVGALLHDAVGRPVLAFYGYEEAYGAFAELYAERGAWIVFAGGFTPIPYKAVTIASGAVGLDPAVFLVASVLSRGARFLIEAALLARFGPAARAFVEKRLALVATVSFALVAAGFAAIEWFL